MSSVSEVKRPLLLSIPGGAGLFPAGLGAAVKVREVLGPKESYNEDVLVGDVLTTRSAPRYGGRIVEYGGVSSGSIVATFLAAETWEFGAENKADPSQAKVYAKYATCFKDLPDIAILLALARHLDTVLPHDIHIRVNKRLHIGVTEYTLKGPQFHVISEYTSKNDVIDTIIHSCSVPPFGVPLWPFKGRFVGDGCVTHNEVILPNYDNYVVKYAHVTGETLPLDWIPTSCLKKYQRLYDLGYTTTERNLQQYGLNLYALQQHGAPIWWRVLKSLGSKALFGYLLWHRLMQFARTRDQKWLLTTGGRFYTLIIPSRWFWKEHRGVVVLLWIAYLCHYIDEHRRRLRRIFRCH